MSDEQVEKEKKSYDIGYCKPPISPGRTPGLPNKATTLGREAIARFVDDGAPLLWGWLQDIAKDSPKAAFDAYMSVVEYHIPKLQRLEQHMTGKVQLEQLIIQRTPKAVTVIENEVKELPAIDVTETKT